MKSKTQLSCILILSFTIFSFGEDRSFDNPEVKKPGFKVYLDGKELNLKKPISTTDEGLLEIMITDEVAFRRDSQVPLGLKLTLVRGNQAVISQEFYGDEVVHTTNLESVLEYSQTGDRLLMQLTNSKLDFFKQLPIQ